MKEQIILNTYDECQSIGQLKLNIHPHKKYVLSKTIPIYEKTAMNIFDVKIKRNDKPTEYFTNILKEQKKNMFVNTFIKKLKSSIILRNPPQHKYLEEIKQSGEENQLQIQFPKFFQLLLLFIYSFHTFSLMILNSMALIFQQINQSSTFHTFMIFSILIHLIQMCSRFLIHLDYQQNKLIKIKQITNKYLEYEFWQDSVVLFSLLMFFILNHNDNNNGAGFIFRLVLFIKIKSLLYIMEHLEITLIENVYREQIWSLIKVFLFNFTFAHILTLLLLLMAGIDQQDNWLVNKGLDDKGWIQKYIWAYYWATTIMLTVGFGDITPRNSKQALCMIFIQMTSCILLAYNINRVGTIIQKIRSYQQQKKSNLKTFNHINQRSQFTNQTKSRLMNYIKQSTQIRRNFNLIQQKQFIESLPQSFQSNILKQMNRHIWNGMMFFQNLSEDTLIKLSIRIERKLAHPQEIIYTRGNDIDIIIFNGGGFGYAYNNGNSTNNGNIIQYFHVDRSSYKIASLDFLFDKKLKYDIKCTDYAVIYKLGMGELVKILYNNSYDSEYFFMIKDKDKFLLNQYEIAECQLCKNELTTIKQRHSVFKCPKLHYLPLKQHIIQKYKLKYYPRIYGYQQQRSRQKKYRTLLKQKSNRKNLISTRNFINNYLAYKSQNRIESGTSFNDFNSFNGSISDFGKDQMDIKSLKSFKNIMKKNQGEFQFVNGELVKQGENVNNNGFNKIVPNTTSDTGLITTTRFYQQAIDQIRSKLDNMIHPTKFAWDLELDVAFNYKFYFRKNNSDQISNCLTNVKKNKVKKNKSFIRKGSKGYRRK